MYNNQNRNFTLIDELPDLEELESNGMNYGMNRQFNGEPHKFGKPLHFANQETQEKIKKFIRPSMGEPIKESGMGREYNHPQQTEFFSPPHPPHPHPPPPQEYLNQENSQPQYSQNSPTCLEIASHVKSCPICSRFYNNDNTIYIIAIIILSIICILLLKRVLNL
jgi:hypothetical protein